jgi:ATP-dependent DNA ligase
MKYNSFRYLVPPRPNTTIKPFSSHFEAMKNRRNWRAQVKKNGQRNLIFIDPDGKVDMWNRHQERHLNYNAPQWVVDEVLASITLTGRWIVIDGELLHNKDKTTKNMLYWWDLLVYDGEYLVGTTYGERHKMLFDVTVPIIDGKRTRIGPNFHPAVDDEIDRHVGDSITLARNISPDRYEDIWKRFTLTSYIEGFVFKDTNAKLMPCIGEKSNGSWQVRCRKPHKAYSF